MALRPTTLAFLGLVLCVSLAQAQTDLTFNLMTYEDVVNHYPGQDSLIGTGDDVLSAANAGIRPSSPNFPGAFSFFTANFTDTPPTQIEFIGEVIRFCTGTVQVQATGLKGNAFSVAITGGSLYGTSADPFVGPSITTLGEQFGAPDSLSASFGSNMLNGTFDHTTAAPQFFGGEMAFPFADQTITAGTVEIVKRANFGSTGDAHLDFVGAVAATTAEVTGIMRVELIFTESQVPDMGLDGTLVHVVLVASTTGEIPPLSPGEEATATPSFTLTLTPTSSPSPTVAMATSTPTFTFTLTPVPTETSTETPTLTLTQTLTQTLTPTVTQTLMQNLTPTLTATIEAMLTCSADLDNDGDIDFQDLLNFVLQKRSLDEQKESKDK